MVFIDGRIGNEDCDILQSLINKSCVFVIDDFEGTEKGVLNALKLRERFRNYILLEPPVLKETGRSGNLALMVPAESLSLSRQQTMPVNM